VGGKVVNASVLSTHAEDVHMKIKATLQLVLTAAYLFPFRDLGQHGVFSPLPAFDD
jgi:hypothetical protein